MTINDKKIKEVSTLQYIDITKNNLLNILVAQKVRKQPPYIFMLQSVESFFKLSGINNHCQFLWYPLKQACCRIRPSTD